MTFLELTAVVAQLAAKNIHPTTPVDVVVPPEDSSDVEASGPVTSIEFDHRRGKIVVKVD